MIQKNNQQVWTNHRGLSVPREYVSKFDRKKETTLGALVKKAERIRALLTDFKVESFDIADQLYTQMMIDANVDSTGRKGNYTLFSFDKSIKLEVNVSDRLEFDENINFAQQKLSDFIAAKTDGADQELRELVNSAFTTTRGRLDTKRIMSLFSLKINHPLWNEAMDLIKKSISVNSTVRYLTLWVRNDYGRYEQINLNFSNIY